MVNLISLDITYERANISRQDHIRFGSPRCGSSINEKGRVLFIQRPNPQPDHWQFRLQGNAGARYEIETRVSDLSTELRVSRFLFNFL